MKKKILFAIDLILPVALFLFGVFLLFKGAVLNLYHLSVFIALPLVMVLVSILYYLRTESKLLKILIVLFLYIPITIVFLIGVLFNFSSFLNDYEGDELIEKYDEVQLYSNLLPSLSEIGDTTAVTYYRFERFYAIFYSESDVLFCEYDEAEYQIQKAEVEEKYVFEDKIEVCDEDYAQYVCYPYAEIDGYLFRRIADDPDDDTYDAYPKSFGIIGTNDETHEIVYIYFNDFDLDYISSFDEFILDDCGWEYIIKEQRWKSFSYHSIVKIIKGRE